MKQEEIKNAKTFDELLDIKYGRIGSPTRDDYEVTPSINAKKLK